MENQPERRFGSLKAIAQTVNDSADCNFVQLVCDESGATILPTYDWTDFFAPHLKKVASIKKYHHFRCDSSQPGVVFVKEHADTDKIALMKCTPPWLPDPNDLPSLVPPKVFQLRDSGTFMRASARFVQRVTRTPLALCLMFQGQAVHQVRLLIAHSPTRKTLNLLQNANVCVALAHKKDITVAHVRTEKPNAPQHYFTSLTLWFYTPHCLLQSYLSVL